MKRITFILALVATVSMLAFSQHLDIPKVGNLKTATTTWDSVFISTTKPPKAVKVSFLNMGSDTLVIAKGADTASVTTDFQYNGTFETDSSGWYGVNTDTLRTTTAQYKTGAKSIRVASTAAAGLIRSKVIANNTNENWTNSVWVKIGLASTDTTIYLHLIDTKGNVLATDTVGLARATWTQLSATATLTTSQTGVQTVIGFVTGAALDTMWVDAATFTGTVDQVIRLAPGMSYVDDSWPLGYLRVKALTTTSKYYMAVGGGRFSYAPIDMPIAHFIDSTGTASVYWQKVDLLSQATRRIETANDGSDTLWVALAASDTVASATRYQTKIYVSGSLKFTTDSQYIYVRAKTATCAYRVRNY